MTDPDIAAVRESLAALARVEARLAETEARLEAAEGAIEFIEGHLELAEEWEPGESVISDANARRVISECLLAARRALAGKDAAA